MPTAWEPWPGNRKAIMRLPAHEDGAPGKAAAEGGHEDEVAALDAAGGQRFLEGHVDGGGAGVAVALDVDEDAVHRQVRALGGGFDDPEIRLVRNEERHVVSGEAVAREDLLGTL